MDRGAWQATVHRFTNSRTQLTLSFLGDGHSSHFRGHGWYSRKLTEQVVGNPYLLIHPGTGNKVHRCSQLSVMLVSMTTT